MFCSRCGKKVMDSMLFCPFCGAKIIIPNQEGELENAAPEGQPTSENEAPEAPARKAVEPFARDLSAASTESADHPEPVSAPLDAVITHSDSDAASSNAPGDKDDLTASAPEGSKASPTSGADENRIPEMHRQGDWSDYLDEKPENGIENASANGTPSKPEAFQRQAQPSNGDEPRVKPFERAHGAKLDGRNKRFIPDDDFMNDDEDFDAFEDEPDTEALRHSRSRDRRESNYDDTDDDDDVPNSFFMRHIRGIVGILLFLMLLVIIALYALSDQGQTQLARLNANLPLNPRSFAKLGREYYDAEDYAQASVYFERALAREPRNYDYAQSAVMAYLSADNTSKAIEMLKKCISINPTAVDPYLYLLNLYPDENTRPWEITELIQKGYDQTKDERLNMYQD